MAGEDIFFGSFLLLAHVGFGRIIDGGKIMREGEETGRNGEVGRNLGRKSKQVY
jgi:hypothetical protein